MIMNLRIDKAAYVVLTHVLMLCWLLIPESARAVTVDSSVLHYTYAVAEAAAVADVCEHDKAKANKYQSGFTNFLTIYAADHLRDAMVIYSQRYAERVSGISSRSHQAEYCTSPLGSGPRGTLQQIIFFEENLIKRSGKSPDLAPSVLAAISPHDAGVKPADATEGRVTQGLSNDTPITTKPVEFSGFYNSMLGFKFLPQLYLATPLLAYLTARQIEAENSEWIDQIAPLLSPTDTHDRPRPAEEIPTVFAFTWDEAQNNQALRSAFFHYFLGEDADWSFLQGYGYDSRKPAIIQLFLFQREQYQNRLPDFAAQSLVPLYKGFLQAVLPEIATSYTMRKPVFLSYDMQQQKMSFQFIDTGSNNFLHKAMYVYTDTPPQNLNNATKTPVSLKGMTVFAAAYKSNEEVSTSMPGLRGERNVLWGPGGTWRFQISGYGHTSGGTTINPPPFLALDRLLAIEPVGVAPAEAENMLLKQQKQGRLLAELLFDITGAAQGETYSMGRKTQDTGILIGKVQNLRILDADDNALLTVALPSGLEMGKKLQQHQEAVAAQAKEQSDQAESESQSETQLFAGFRLACYTGEPYPWTQTVACLQTTKEAETKTKSGHYSAALWDFIRTIDDDLAYFIRNRNGLESEISSACSIGATRKARATHSGYIDSSPCKKEVISSLEKEKLSPAKQPQDNNATRFIRDRVPFLVDKYYGL